MPSGHWAHWSRECGVCVRASGGVWGIHKGWGNPGGAGCGGVGVVWCMPCVRDVCSPLLSFSLSYSSFTHITNARSYRPLPVTSICHTPTVYQPRSCHHTTPLLSETSPLYEYNCLLLLHIIMPSPGHRYRFATVAIAITSLPAQWSRHLLFIHHTPHWVTSSYHAEQIGCLWLLRHCLMPLTHWSYWSPAPFHCHIRHSAINPPLRHSRQSYRHVTRLFNAIVWSPLMSWFCLPASNVAMVFPLRQHAIVLPCLSGFNTCHVPLAHWSFIGFHHCHYQCLRRLVTPVTPVSYHCSPVTPGHVWPVYHAITSSVCSLLVYACHLPSRLSPPCVRVRVARSAYKLVAAIGSFATINTIVI